VLARVVLPETVDVATDGVFNTLEATDCVFFSGASCSCSVSDSSSDDDDDGSKSLSSGEKSPSSDDSC